MNTEHSLASSKLPSQPLHSPPSVARSTPKRRTSQNSSHDSIELQSRHSSNEASQAGEPDTRNNDQSAKESVYEPWLQLLVGHLVLFNCFGLIQSFSIFQVQYAGLFQKSTFVISWIGSIHIFLAYAIGTFSNKALDAGYYKQCLGIGLMIQLVGITGAVSCSSYGLSLAFHGVLQGIGHGMMFCPAITNTALYFWKRDETAGPHNTRRGLPIGKVTAMSLAACGGANGGIIFPIIARYTMVPLGVAWTLRIIGLVVLFNSVVIFALAKERKVTDKVRSQKRQIWELKAFYEGSYAFYVVAMFLIFVGLWVPYFYVREFTATALHIPPRTSLLILLTLNASGIPGRILPALISDYFLGTINTYIIVLGLTSATLFCWPLVVTTPGMFAWASAYGFCAGGIAFLPQAGIASLNEDPDKTGVKIGMAFTIMASASLIGGPVGGALIGAGEKSAGKDGREKFLWLQITTGAFMMVGCWILMIARGLAKGWRIMVKV